jgi:hypothetical protein
MGGIVDVGREKFRWMTTNELLELRMLLRAKSGYSGSMDTGGG